MGWQEERQTQRKRERDGQRERDHYGLGKRYMGLTSFDHLMCWRDTQETFWRNMTVTSYDACPLDKLWRGRKQFLRLLWASQMVSIATGCLAEVEKKLAQLYTRVA